MTYLQARAAEIDFELDRLECLRLIDEWNNAQTSVAALSANEIASYSIAGRSVQRKGTGELADRVSDLYAQIQGYLYGRGIVLLDHRNLLRPGDA